MAAKWENWEAVADAIERAEGVELERIKVRLLLQLAISGREISAACRRLSLIAPESGTPPVVIPMGPIYKVGHG